MDLTPNTMPRSYKTLPRLHVAHDLGDGAQVALDHDQTNYLLNVLRMKAGDALIVFNGRDGAWMARIASDHRKGAVLTAAVQTAHQTPKPDLWFGFAPLKTGRMDYLVQKATEMGAGVIQPVITRYTQARNLRADKLEANIIEAAEQCEVLSIPRLADEVGLEQLVANWQQTQGLRRLVFCDESAPSHSPVKRLRDVDGLPVGVLVGPEGGFSDEERVLLLGQPWVIPISLGPRILRADTAAVAALTVVQSIIGDWR